MRIGELARSVGVSTDTVRFYEREGLLPRPARRENGYREYTQTDVEHLRLLIDLRSLEVPPQQAAHVATMCHAGHCADTTRELPALVAQQLDNRLTDLGSPPHEAARRDAHGVGRRLLRRGLRRAHRGRGPLRLLRAGAGVAMGGPRGASLLIAASEV